MLNLLRSCHCSQSYVPFPYIPVARRSFFLTSFSRSSIILSFPQWLSYEIIILILVYRWTSGLVHNGRYYEGCVEDTEKSFMSTKATVTCCGTRRSSKQTCCQRQQLLKENTDPKSMKTSKVHHNHFDTIAHSMIRTIYLCCIG